MPFYGADKECNLEARSETNQKSQQLQLSQLFEVITNSWKHQYNAYILSRPTYAYAHCPPKGTHKLPN